MPANAAKMFHLHQTFNGISSPFLYASNKVLARTVTVLRNSFEGSAISQTKMITEYGRVGEINKAREVFEKMSHRNQVSWNAMLKVLIESNKLNSARQLFERMPQKNSTSYTLMIVGFSKLGFISEACGIFDTIPIRRQNVITWTAMISCYSKNSQPLHALKLFASLYGDFFSLKILPNSYTFSILVKLCSDVMSLVNAVQIHSLMVKLLDEGQKKFIFVSNSLMNLYSKLGHLDVTEKIFNGLEWKDLISWNIMMTAYVQHLLIDKAFEIFNSMEEKDIISWNSIIWGFAESGSWDKALELFIKLFRLCGQQIKPNSHTYTIILTVCATLCMPECGRSVHACTVKNGLCWNDIYTGNSLIHMYARCGLIEESEQAFDDMHKRDVVSWNSLVLGLVQNGQCREALEVAEKAFRLGVYNRSTFIAVLTGCDHGGLVKEGLQYLKTMSSKYGIEPMLDHYICVIDMLGRAGRIEEAYLLLQEMPFAPNSVAWQALLSSCALHGNDMVGEVAAWKLQNLDPYNTASYVMLAQIYGRAGRVELSRQILEVMDEIGLKKENFCSWIS